MNTCGECVKPYGASACGWCVKTNSCGMSYDSCAGEKLVTDKAKPSECPEPVIVEYPGEDFFKSVSKQLAFNPNQRNYGVSVTDIDKDGSFEFVVAGFGSRNLAYKWNAEKGLYDEIADEVLQDSKRKAIGLAACDIDGDGYEELYVLNTDQYSGDTTTSDGLFDHENGKYFDLFTEERNLESGNFVAGRSCACVDREGNGKYSVVVANYGGQIKVFEINEDNVLFDAAPDAGMDLKLGGRALVAGPIISDRMDVFSNNEVDYTSRVNGYYTRANYMFVHEDNEDGTYENVAKEVGLADDQQTGRGTALLDANGDGLVDIVYGNWNGPHRLYLQSRNGDDVKFTDAATEDMAVPSKIRTVIVADFDNDGYEEIFYNNIPGENRLFRKLPDDEDWVRINIGDAVERDGMGTGGAVGDFDGDGMLELVVAHGESGPMQPLSLFKCNWGVSNHYLRILPKTLHGAPARGARVDLVAGGRNQMRIIDAGSGYLCQMEPVAHFGLGQLKKVEKVRVMWTDASVCEFVPKGIDGVIEVHYKSAGNCEYDEADVVPNENFEEKDCRAKPESEVVAGNTQWKGKNTDDFFNEYYNIFKSRNRNAASHKWAAFLLERSLSFDEEMFTKYFASFCPVSGSIVYTNDFKRYGMTIKHAANSNHERFGYMYFCCWPCICDTQDFIRYDTKTVKVQGENGGYVEKEFIFVVEPEPCEGEAKLEEEWIEPFRGQKTTLYKSAPELKCVAGKTPGKKVLEGAILSDNGYPIIGMIHDSVPITDDDDTFACKDDNTDEPGRMRDAHNGKGQYQSACEFKQMCAKRAKQGYNSGMGMIFRKVAGIGKYKDMCMDGEEPKVESKESEESESEEPKVVCKGKQRSSCIKDDNCMWNAILKCLSDEELKAEMGIWAEFDGTFNSYKKVCSSGDSKLCKTCGGKVKKGKCTKLTEKKVKCKKLKSDKYMCTAVPGCSLSKKGSCKGKAKFAK